jgi:ferredoxin
MTSVPPPGTQSMIDRSGLQALIDVLAADGFQVLGPTRRDDAIVYDHIAGVDDLPAGWTDHQEPGRYRLERRGDQALFGYAVGPHSWKRFLHPPMETLWQARRDGDSFTLAPPRASVPRYAFIGVRACELRAIAIQDRVFCAGKYPDTAYAKRRRAAFIVAVNCGEAGGNCFCVSMGSGPKADAGFDLALTELLDGNGHHFLVEAGSETGAAVLARLDSRAATVTDTDAAGAVIERTAANMGRQMNTHGLKELLQGNPEHPRWDEVAERCLSCGNCTMVCPTCFCTSVDDHTSVDGTSAERVRSWDSCFTMDFSYIHGGSVRHTPKARYRQWMTHKLAHWIDQFGTSGCVGCGRCISWCPVGIDITEEAAAIRAAVEAAEEADDGHA